MPERSLGHTADDRMVAGPNIPRLYFTRWNIPLRQQTVPAKPIVAGAFRSGFNRPSCVSASIRPAQLGIKPSWARSIVSGPNPPNSLPVAFPAAKTDRPWERWVISSKPFGFSFREVTRRRATHGESEKLQGFLYNVTGCWEGGLARG